MVVRIGTWRFAPRWVPTLATLVLLPILLSLGMWQMGRGAEKSAQAEVHEARLQAPPAPLTELPADADEARYRRVVARGRYDADAQVLHAYQPREGRLGFHVYTPFEVTGAAEPRHVLVYRGWVPHGRERLDVPPLPVPEGQVELRGMVERLPAVGLRLGPADDGLQGWPRVVQYMEFEYLEEALHRRLRPFVLMLDADAPGALQPNWILFHMGPERHYGYALQWFGLALALLVIYIAVNTRRVAPRGRG